MKFEIYQDDDVVNNQIFDMSKNSFIDDTPIFDVCWDDDVMYQLFFVNAKMVILLIPWS